MKNKLLLISIGLLTGMPVAAQLKAHYGIYGNVMNSVTRKDLIGARVYLERPDGTVTDSCQINWGNWVGNRDAVYSFYLPKQGGHYRLRCEADGYETELLNIDSIPFTGRNAFRHTGDILMRRRQKERQLGAATVTASKVKIYTKGDTIVYNADAFQLAEGSMLDALIRQLPGAELKDDGRILVNGKQVESLLLNGDDFFKGNNQVMLDNLPSYMVQNVQVYDKDGRLSKFAGKNMGDRELVMDVKLKKQYSIGWIANVEGGYGTEERYLGRLFALRFTPQSRVSLYGNMNNLNDNRKPGENSEWTPEKMPLGLVTTKTGGLDYQVKDRLQHYEVNGSASVNYTGGDFYTRTSAVSFLPQGDTYRYGNSRQTNSNLSVSTQHYFEYKWSNMQETSIRPSFSHRRWKNHGNSLSATFSEDPFPFAGTGLLDSISRPDAGPLLRRLALNRYLAQSKGEGHTTSANVGMYTYLKPNNSDIIIFNAWTDWQESRSDNFSHTLYDYPAAGGTLPSDFRNRWSHSSPDRELTYGFKGDYYFWFPNNLCITPGYSFSQEHTDKDYALNRLEQLDGWAEGSDHPLGALPSEVDFTLRTLDLQNSYRHNQTNTWHQVNLYSKWEGKGDSEHSSGYWRVSINLPVRFARYRMTYSRAGKDLNPHRNTVFFQPHFKLERYWNSWNSNLTAEYRLSATAVDLTDLLDIESNSDPLNIHTGNPALKDTKTHNINVRMKHNRPDKQRFFSGSAGYRLRKDAKTMSFTYDRATGVRRYRPDNINGNYIIWGSANYTLPLDHKRRLTLNTYTYGEYSHSVDLISTTTEAPQRSTGRITWITETLRLDYRIRKVKIGAKGYLGYNNVRSSREDFGTQNVYDFNYGPTLQADLPWGIQFSTDLTLYCRRGYDDPEANTNNLVWNARLSKRVPKANLTFLIDGFDMLGKLSNLTMTMNSQGRTETYRNVIPRYFMAHVIYRLNIKPKKKPGE